MAQARLALACVVLCVVLCGGLAMAGPGDFVLLKGGVSLVPARTICAWLGADMEYAAGEITATRGNSVAVMTMGSREARINGSAVALRQPPCILSGTGFIPLKAMADAFGATIEFETPWRTVYVIEGDKRLELPVVVDRGDWLRYRGAWFDADFPRDFRVVQREPSRTTGLWSLYDGVSFMSPDGDVEFYVFSPMWTGTSEWISLKPGERQTDISHGRDKGRDLTWVTIEGPDGTYTRAYVESRDESTNHYFGIKYPDQATYDKYRARYMKFKASLVQYLD